MRKIVRLLAIGLAFSGCAPSYYYTTTAPVRIYADDHMTSRRLQNIPAGAVLSVSDKSLLRSHYLIPVNYEGYRVYAYLPAATYLRSERGVKLVYKSSKNIPSYQEPVADYTNTQKHNTSAYQSYPGGRVFYSGNSNINR